MTETLADRLIRHEGLRLAKYRDSLGFWTIGYGHKITEADGDRYDTPMKDEPAARALLNDDIESHEALLFSQMRWAENLDNVRLDVMIELVFWIGIGGLWQFHHFLADMKEGNWSGVAQELLNSLLHTQAPKRVEELSNLILNGCPPQ